MYILIASNAQPINHKTDNNNVAPFTRWNDSLHEAIWKTFNSMFIWRSALSEPQKNSQKNVTRFLFYIYVKCQKHAIGYKSVQRQNQVMFGVIDVNKMQSKTLHSIESHLCDVFQMSEMFMHKCVFFIELTEMMLKLNVKKSIWFASIVALRYFYQIKYKPKINPNTNLVWFEINL